APAVVSVLEGFLALGAGPLVLRLVDSRTPEPRAQPPAGGGIKAVDGQPCPVPAPGPVVPGGHRLDGVETGFTPFGRRPDRLVRRRRSGFGYRFHRRAGAGH